MAKTRIEPITPFTMYNIMLFPNRSIAISVKQFIVDVKTRIIPRRKKMEVSSSLEFNVQGLTPLTRRISLPMKMNATATSTALNLQGTNIG